jgi:hypothetical protein
MAITTEPPMGPEWLAAEMPPGYRNRLEEMERLARDLDAMGRFGRLLTAAGPDLRDAVLETFLAIGFDAGPARPDGIIVTVDPGRRLLVHVSAGDGAIGRRDPALAQVFQMLHEIAGDGDRVVLVANHEPETRPADRGPGIDTDALALLKRLAANFLPSPVLFTIWSASLQDRPHARSIVERLHAQDGGVFAAPALLSV